MAQYQWLTNWPNSLCFERQLVVGHKSRGFHLAERIIGVGLAWCEHKHRGARHQRVKGSGNWSVVRSAFSSYFSECSALHAKWTHSLGLHSELLSKRTPFPREYSYGIYTVSFKVHYASESTFSQSCIQKYYDRLWNVQLYDIPYGTQTCSLILQRSY